MIPPQSPPSSSRLSRGVSTARRQEAVRKIVTIHGGSGMIGRATSLRAAFDLLLLQIHHPDIGFVPADSDIDGVAGDFVSSGRIIRNRLSSGATAYCGV